MAKSSKAVRAAEQAPEPAAWVELGPYTGNDEERAEKMRAAGLEMPAVPLGDTVIGVLATPQDEAERVAQDEQEEEALRNESASQRAARRLLEDARVNKRILPTREEAKQAKITRREGVWTMDMMEEEAPVQADLYDDGRFLFTFKPILNRVAAQKRFRLAKKVNQQTLEGYYELTKGYAEVLKMVLVTWPLMEEVEDDDGNVIYEEVPDAEPDPETGMVPLQAVLRPLPLTLNNIERLRTEVAVQLFQAMERAMRGEANGRV